MVPVDVLYAVARARRGVVLTPGITVIGAPGASAAPVMPGVQRTPGLPRGGDARGVARSELDLTLSRSTRHLFRTKENL